MSTFTGVYTALITPFRDGRIDKKALEELVEEQVAGNVDGLIPCGTTGESVNLTDAEHKEVIQIVVERVAGRIPVVAGAGTASTRHTMALCRAAKEAKADGLLIVAPYYNRPTQEGLFAHYQAIAQETSLPIMLYNIPGRTGVDVALSTLERIAELKQVVAIKEATGKASRTQEIMATFGDRFTVLSGDDALTVAIMAVGGHGVVSVASNVAPRQVSEVVHRFQEDEQKAALALHQKLLPLHKALFVESSPGPVKAALAILKRIAPEIRLPLIWPTEQTQAILKNALEQVGIVS